MAYVLIHQNRSPVPSVAPDSLRISIRSFTAMDQAAMYLCIKVSPIFDSFFFVDSLG